MTTDTIHKDENLKILSLEDSVRDFDLIKELLIDAGYRLSIAWVKTEVAFTASLRDQVWDVILADFKLPGFDAFGAVRIRNEICPDTPFICVSGSIGEETAIELLKAGAVDYVLKDRPNRLPFAVGRALDEAREKKIRQHNDEALKVAYRQLKASQAATLGILEDLKAENQARQAKETELRKITLAVEQTGEVVMITDPDGMIQYVNPTFTDVSGFSREEVVGQNPRLLKSGQQDRAFYQELWGRIANGNTWYGRLVNKRKDGTLYTEESTISPVKDELGRILSYVAVKRDITEMLHKEEERAKLQFQLNHAQKMDSVGRLAGGVAHDFNNLLMGIMGYTELCQEQIEPDHPIREFLDEIKTGSQRSAEITRQLLAFARKQIIAPMILDLNDAVAGMLRLLQRLIGEDIKMTWRPGSDLPPVRIDPSQVDQILANLCVNARDAIASVGEVALETGRIVVDAEYCAEHPEAIPGAYVFLSVSDNGCGMDKETLAQVFEPFFTTKGVGKGTGLGLATVYGIVKQNSGFIYAYSEPAKGTTFKIYLPEIAAEAKGPVTRKAEAPRGRGETILLVEDEQMVRKACSRFLEALGYKALEAETPGEALVIANRHGGDIHLLLTDVVMPGMDGRQLAQRISAVKPGVKVVFMSGYTSDVIGQRGVVDEGVQFLSKPFTRDDLARKVRKVLEAD